MSKDLSIKNFAFVLFRKMWVDYGIPDILRAVKSYTEATACGTECPDEIINAVYLRHIIFRSYYESVLEVEYSGFYSSRLALYSYFITHCCDHFESNTLPVMEKILVTAAFLAAMGLCCASKNNLGFVYDCPLIWATYFDMELKNEFYEVGGWAKLQQYSIGFQEASVFVISFPCQLNVCEQLMEYFEFYTRELVNTFDERTAEKWKGLTNALVTMLIFVTDKSKILSDSLKFKALLYVPVYLHRLFSSTDFNILSYITKNRLSPCPNDMSYLQFDVLDSFLQSECKDSRNLILYSHLDHMNRDECRFFNHYRKTVAESSAEKSEIGNDQSFPIWPRKGQIDENSTNNTAQNSTNYCSEVNRIINSTKNGETGCKPERNQTNRMKCSGDYDISEQDGTVLKQGMRPKRPSISMDNDCVLHACRRDGVKQEEKSHSQTIESEPIPLLHYKDAIVNERASTDKNPTEVAEHETRFTTENYGAIPKSKKRIPEETSHSYHALLVQNESPDLNRVSIKQISSPNQNHPFTDFKIGSSSVQKCIKTVCGEISKTIEGSKSVNPLSKNDFSNQCAHRNICGAKAPNKGRKKHKRKKKKPLQKSVMIKIKTQNTEDDVHLSTRLGTQENLDIILRHVLVLGVPF